jgi:hypothetical protein
MACSPSLLQVLRRSLSIHVHLFMPSYKTSLDLLADAAAQRASSDDSSDDFHDSIPSPSSSCSMSSEFPPKLLERSNTVGFAACGTHQLRPRKKAHKPHKASRLHIKSKPELRVRRKELMDRACGIKSLENSPVNEQQLFVLRTVYDEVLHLLPLPYHRLT